MELAVVGLPIGNIEDISYRAIKKLTEANVVLCEDTRYFNALWQKLSQNGLITTPLPKLMVVNDFNEKTNFRQIFDNLTEVEKVVLVSDAGMPLVSDPGYKILQEAAERDVKLEIVPGPTAMATAAIRSGLPIEKMLFLGFLPKKPGKRLTTIKSAVTYIAEMGGSIVLYESPFRLNKLLAELETVETKLSIFVGVDLTKMSEKSFKGSIDDLKKILKTKNIKGECTVVIGVDEK